MFPGRLISSPDNGFFMSRALFISNAEVIMGIEIIFDKKF